MNVMLRISFVAALLLALPAHAEPLGTQFTYQGELKIDGVPADGPWDFRILLYNAATGGSFYGEPLIFDDWPVTNGVFTVELDWGIEPFNGEQWWLALDIRPYNTVQSYELLQPRQMLTSTPHALYAMTTGDIPESYKAQITTLETNFSGVQSDVAILQTQVSDLQTDLAAQMMINQQQQTSIQSLIRFIRDGNRRQDFLRVRDGVRNRLNALKLRLQLRQQGVIPASMPATVLFNEMSKHRDLAETLRCQISNLAQLPADDCMTTGGDPIAEDAYAVSADLLVEYETYSDDVEVAIVDAQAAVDAAIASGSPECTLWEADPENDVKLALCLASVGVSSAETFVGAIAMTEPATTATIGAYDESQTCPDFIITGGVDPCADFDGDAASVGAWESITIEGEANPFSEPNCTAVTANNIVTGAVNSTCF